MRDSCNAAPSVLLMQQVSLHAQRKPASRTIVQNISNFMSLGDPARSWIDPCIISWWRGSSISHVWENVAYLKYSCTPWAIAASSICNTIDETSCLNFVSASNTRIRSCSSHRCPFLVSIRTSGKSRWMCLAELRMAAIVCDGFT